MKLDGKVAIVTGSSSGIGYAVADAFVAHGAKVAVCGINTEDIKKACLEIDKNHPGCEIIGINVDISKTEAVKRMVSAVINKWGKIDILVNNAGICQSKSLLDTTDDDYYNVFNVNTFGTIRCTREVLKYMKDNKDGGVIINTSSVVGIYGSTYSTAYASSKFAINGLTKSWSKELGAYNIRVNGVAPGAVLTPMMDDMVDEAGQNSLAEGSVLKRIAEPNDLAGAYVYLASDEAKFTTGTIIQVDGGLMT